MSFANPWGLLALVSLPIIIGIHMFHRKFPRLEIAGSHLWDLDAQTTAPGRRRERLPITRTLLFELLAALILSLILAQPQVTHLTTATHLVVVLDDSASMSAELSDGRTVRDHCVEWLENRVRETSGDVVATLLVSGRRAENLSGTAVPWRIARTGLELWQPTASTHEFGFAWDIAAQLAGASGQLIFLTNRMPEEEDNLPASMEVIALGEPRENVAIELAQWRVDDQSGEGRLYVRVSNPGRQRQRVTVLGRSGDRLVVDENLSLGGGETRPLDVAIGQGLNQMTLELVADQDALELDSRVVLVEPKQRTVRVQVRLPPESTATQSLTRVLDILPGVERVADGDVDLSIGPAADRPTSDRDLWWLGVGPLDSSEAAGAASVDLLSPFLIDRSSPLLDGMVLGGIIWGGVQPWDEEVIPLISADDQVLLGRLRQTQTNAYVLNLDLARSNLSDSPDWPVFVANLVEQCRADRYGLRRWNVRLNESLRLRLPLPKAGDEAFELVHDDDKSPLRLDQDGTVEIDALASTGVFEIRKGARLWDRFAVNFSDATQSDLTRLNAAESLPESDLSEPFRLENAYTWLMLVGVLLIVVILFANWIELRRGPSGIRT